MQSPAVARVRLQFALALSDAVLALAEAEGRQLDLRNRDADEVLPLLADHFAVGDVLLQILLDAASDDLPEPKMILFDVKNHKRFMPSFGP